MASPFSPEELAYLEAHKDDSRVSEIHWVYTVPIVAATISTALRLWAKRLGRNGITLDDYLILLATFCLIGECSSGLGYGPPHGMGRHVIVVSDYDQMMVRKGDYIFSHFYDFALVFVKLGILAFYWRVFVHPVFRTAVLATAFFVIAWGIGITVTLFLACRPLKAYWDITVKGDCLTMVTFTYFTNISNLITDIWVFLMPIPMIWHLQLQTKKKLIISLIFCFGLATCIVSSIRLTVVLGRGSPDFTWYYVPLGAYSVFEPLGGILCTNIPIIWHMLRKHRAMNRTMENLQKTHDSSTRTIGSGSRRSRIINALGITTHDRTQNDSVGGTVVEGGDRAADFHRLESMESQKPDPNIWTTVQRLDSGSAETGRSSDEGHIKPGMKKTNWHVRR
ncbi:hypothetical protein HBI81_036470 [Parastagonospora nodorum]|nr:hypothetical protein HBI33_157770 [Parastagonospora nodorum]KAH5685124.1 hypothetical protein HBI21_007910 [Parastagonospora nodorum]KAH6079879.1 hypothetical protein HBI67_032870 [Parastagonospora nodorum]KAH6092152.1 hypothetical protein HBI66_002930 [Parastagonospora nodorum]KAH6542250.1 hypothetical protein HBI81_036470 [Parastagonospora nodorum]